MPMNRWKCKWKLTQHLKTNWMIRVSVTQIRRTVSLSMLTQSSLVRSCWVHRSLISRGRSSSRGWIRRVSALTSRLTMRICKRGPILTENSTRMLTTSARQQIKERREKRIKARRVKHQLIMEIKKIEEIHRAAVPVAVPATSSAPFSESCRI